MSWWELALGVAVGWYVAEVAQRMTWIGVGYFSVKRRIKRVSATTDLVTELQEQFAQRFGVGVDDGPDADRSA